MTSQHRPGITVSERNVEFARGVVDTRHRRRAGRVFCGNTECVEIHVRGRSQPREGVGCPPFCRVGRLLCPVAAQDRGEDVHRGWRVGGFRGEDAVRVGLGGGEVEVVLVAAAGQRHIEVLAAELIVADDVGGVGGDALAGVDGGRVTQPGVGGDVSGGQSHHRVGVAAQWADGQRTVGLDRPDDPAVSVFHPGPIPTAQPASIAARGNPVPH